MNFAEENNKALYLISHYDDLSISVNNQCFQFNMDCQSLFVSPKQLDTTCLAQSIKQLKLKEMDNILTWQPEIIIFGTGKRSLPPPSAILKWLAKEGIGFEFMDTFAACRTYNILANEGRTIAALLFHPSITGH